MLTAATILFLIGSIAWMLGALVHLLTSYSERRALKQTLNVRRKDLPKAAFWLTRASWLQLIATIGLVIASAISIGQSVGTATAAGILWLIFFTVWVIASGITLALSLLTIAMAPLMPDMISRHRSWLSVLSILGLFAGLLLFEIGSILWIALRPPGIVFIANLLFLVASLLLSLGYLNHLLTTYAFYVPVTGLMVGVTGAGPTGQLAPAVGAVAPSHGVSKLDVVPGYGGMPVITNVAPPGVAAAPQTTGAPVAATAIDVRQPATVGGVGSGAGYGAGSGGAMTANVQDVL